MKFTLSWLKDHLETSASQGEIVDALTRVGLEVEGVEDPAAKLKPFRIARVVSAEKHPNADKLKVLMVDTGEGAPVQVVCGAPNARAGLLGVFAPPGTHIPGTGVDLAVGTIRGVESRGMMCSERELELSEDHNGIIDLTADFPVGTPYAETLGLDDPVIDIAITPNRPDCLGVHGVARDLAAAGLGRLKSPERPVPPATFESSVRIELDFSPETAEACPVFAGRVVRGLRNGASPAWMQARLKAIGLRPISALVDITNYMTFDRGRPLHVYDVKKLTGAVVRARLGRPGESFLALNGRSYEIDGEMTAIADDGGVLGLGGVMGGVTTGVDETTTEVLIESAYFDPTRTAKTGRRTGINSDARYRFERGIDPASCLSGADEAASLILALCGGEASGMVVAGREPVRAFSVDFPVAEVKRLSGLDLPRSDVVATLRALGFKPEGETETLTVAVPSWRPDVHGKADLVEEVVRIAGLDRVVSTALPRLADVAGKVLTPIQVRTRRARRVLAVRGLVEAVTWSFISKSEATLFGGGKPELELANSISAELSDMRPSLIPGLLSAARRNVDRGFSDLALFEVGQVFAGDRPEDQSTSATALRRGTARPDGAGRHWSGATGAVSALDAKADALALLDALGVDTSRLQLARTAPAWFHPGRSGALQMGPQNVFGWFGEIHPAVLAAMDVEGPIVACEILLERLPQPKAKASRAKPVLSASDLMPVRRDFAFVVDEAVEAARIVKAAEAAAKPLVSGTLVFDVYRGEHVGAGRKSVAIEVTLQPKDRTLTEDEIDAAGKAIVAAVEKATGGALRV
jgi:phenylalanyl-tRNA synthetase beta chain